MNNLLEEKRCETCRWHYYTGDWDDWVCVNSDSDYCADFTMHDDSCGEWESKREDE